MKRDQKKQQNQGMDLRLRLETLRDLQLSEVRGGVIKGNTKDEPSTCGSCDS